MTLQRVFVLRNEWSFVNGCGDCTMKKFAMNKNGMDYKLGCSESWTFWMILDGGIKCYDS